MHEHQARREVVAEFVHEHQHAQNHEKREGTLQHGGHDLAYFRFS